MKIKAYQIELKTTKFTYSLNTRYIFDETYIKNPTVILLHGHGGSCTWAAWLKLGLILHEDEKRNCILIDLPGYGHSRLNN